MRGQRLYATTTSGVMGFGISGLLYSRCSLDRREADGVWRTPTQQGGPAQPPIAMPPGGPQEAIDRVSVPRRSAIALSRVASKRNSSQRPAVRSAGRRGQAGGSHSGTGGVRNRPAQPNGTVAFVRAATLIGPGIASARTTSDTVPGPSRGRAQTLARFSTDSHCRGRPGSRTRLREWKRPGPARRLPGLSNLSDVTYGGEHSGRGGAEASDQRCRMRGRTVR